jgi:hypothetical protein
MALAKDREPRRSAQSAAVTVSHPDLEWRETIQGSKPGDRFVRVATHKDFTRVRPGHLVPRPGTGAPTTRLGRALQRVKYFVIGSPIPTARESHERLNVFKGLAVFASDNISSSAYATEEIMRVLVLASAAALTLTMPITIAIVIVLAIVVTSYQQTIRAYPSGGGSYIGASDNLGPVAGLTAAGALLTDYVLTVSVSIAAGVAALTSIFPELFDLRVAVGVGFVVLLTLGNLRGIRESGTIFSAPTYVYLFAIYGLLGYGLYRFATGTLPEYQPPPEWVQAESRGAEALGLFLILRAFSAGSVALTGTEAVSNGVPAFKPPESGNARIVLIMMGACFGSVFLGMSFSTAGHRARGARWRAGDRPGAPAGHAGRPSDPLDTDRVRPDQDLWRQSGQGAHRPHAARSNLGYRSAATGALAARLRGEASAEDRGRSAGTATPRHRARRRLPLRHRRGRDTGLAARHPGIAAGGTAQATQSARH